MADFAYEIAYGAAQGRIVCGIDEVGRGPLAGPVVAAAIILPIDQISPELGGQIRDSKRLSAKKRQYLYDHLVQNFNFAVAESSVKEIDQINILQASLLAMSRAVEKLPQLPHHALVDGNKLPALPCSATAIVGGDDKCLSIAAASIIAKVLRDEMMCKLALEHPEYGWDKNAGYGTAKHLAALHNFGATIWHRKSFAPVAAVCASLKSSV